MNKRINNKLPHLTQKQKKFKVTYELVGTPEEQQKALNSVFNILFEETLKRMQRNNKLHKISKTNKVG